jgi:hypothetical protein
LQSSRLAHTCAPPPSAARCALSRGIGWTGLGPKVSWWRG